MGNGNKDEEKLIINKPDINFTDSSDWIGFCRRSQREYEVKLTGTQDTRSLTVWLNVHL